MSSVYCDRCDTNISDDMREFHDNACGPIMNQELQRGYDPYNSADRFEHQRREHRSDDFYLPSLLRQQAE